MKIGKVGGGGGLKLTISRNRHDASCLNIAIRYKHMNQQG